jgi:hypothetical protein
VSTKQPRVLSSLRQRHSARESPFPSGSRATTSWWAGDAWRLSHLRCSSLIQDSPARESSWPSPLSGRD